MFSANEQNQFFESALFEATGWQHHIGEMQFLSGGCINVAVRLVTNVGSYFVKFNEAPQAYEMFEAEAKGLALLRQALAQSAAAVLVPQVIHYGRQHGKAFLVLEYLPPAAKQPRYWQLLGEGLAALHRCQQASHGLHFNNYIGSLAQSNEAMPNGTAFYIEKRLRVQAGLAYYKGLADVSLLKKLDLLYEKLPQLLPQEPAALLHGDLWGGNVITGPQGQPCLIDPAVYYGFREAEVAYTELFGGFEPEFYEAYNEAYPLETGFRERAALYNLYPLLVHVNLFGPAYLSGVENNLRRFV